MKPFDKYKLGKEEEYNAGDPIDGIEARYSNMAGVFQFEFKGHVWKNSEELYLLGEFSTDSTRDLEIQRDILSAKSGYAAKRFKKAKYRADVRPDFKEFRLQWMLFVVWQKCKGSETFRRHLLEAPLDAILVENTTTDNGGTAEIWGCRNPELMAERMRAEKELRNSASADMTKAALDRLVLAETNKIKNIGTWRGQNNIGKIIMMPRSLDPRHRAADRHRLRASVKIRHSHTLRQG